VSRNKTSSNIKVNYKGALQVNTYPGVLIALEGLDGSGQTTQARLLSKYTEDKGLKVWMTKEPTDGPAGAAIKFALSRKLEVDNQTLQMLFTTDRSDHLNYPGGIISRLKESWVVVTDRYLWSTLAYGHAGGLDPDWLLAMQSKFVVPDITFFLETPVSTSLERMKTSRLRLDLYETREMLEGVRSGYHMIIKKYPKQFIRIKGTDTIEQISIEIRKKIEKNSKFKGLVKSIQSKLPLG
jgi:dTMP kinase